MVLEKNGHVSERKHTRSVCIHWHRREEPELNFRLSKTKLAPLFASALPEKGRRVTRVLSSWETASLCLLPNSLLGKKQQHLQWNANTASWKALTFYSSSVLGCFADIFFIEIFSYLLWGSRVHVCTQVVMAGSLRIHIFTCHMITCLPACVLCHTKLLYSKPKCVD